MDCLLTVFVDEFLNISTFFADLLELGCPERLSSSTVTQPSLKRECHSKSAVWIKEYSPKASQSISRVLVVDLPSCRHIARYCYPPQTKQNRKSKKHLCKNNACSQRAVTWQTDAIGCKVWPWLGT
jgi:hypothetical protein